MIWTVRESKPAPTSAEMRRVEGELGVRFNEEYRDFISRHNGGYVEEENVYDIPPDNNSDVHGIVSLDRLPYTYHLVADQAGAGIMPIMFDSSGNHICMDMSGRNDGSVYFLHHEIPGREALTLLAKSLNAFLELVRPDDTEVVLKDSPGNSVWIHPDFQKILDEQKKK
jgi:cell wall assembly regulator SMI1